MEGRRLSETQYLSTMGRKMNDVTESADYLVDILLFTNQNNSYVVFIVDIIHKTILGHYMLDLYEKYGVNR